MPGIYLGTEWASSCRSLHFTGPGRMSPCLLKIEGEEQENIPHTSKLFQLNLHVRRRRWRALRNVWGSDREREGWACCWRGIMLILFKCELKWSNISYLCRLYQNIWPTISLFTLGLKPSSRCFFCHKAFRPCQIFCMTPRKLLRCVATFYVRNVWKKNQFFVLF